MNLFLQILSNLEAWFVSLKIRINSPTYIINMASSIETLPDGEAKEYLKHQIKFFNGKDDKDFNKFLKQEGI